MAIVLAYVLADAQALIVIDDFSVAQPLIQLSSPGTVSNSGSVPLATREMRIDAANVSSTVNAEIFSSIGELQGNSSGSDFNIEWTLNYNFTLAQDFSSSQLVQIRAASFTTPNVASILLQLTDGTNTQTASQAMPTAITNFDFALSSFSSVNLAAVTRLSVKIVDNGSGGVDPLIDFIHVVPEPVTVGLVLTGMGILGVCVRRRTV